MVSSSLQSESSSLSIQIWFHHKHLRHSPFYISKSMFLTLFLHTCEIEQHHCVSYPPSLNKKVESFDFVHSNIWGPTLISNLFLDEMVCFNF